MLQRHAQVISSLANAQQEEMACQTFLKGSIFPTPRPPGGSTVSQSRETPANCQAFQFYSSVIAAAGGISLREYV